MGEFFEPIDGTTLAELEKPFAKNPSAASLHPAPDTNINQDRWPLVRNHYDLAQWPERCRAAKAAAAEALVRTVDLAQITEELVVLLQTDTALVKEQSYSRIDALKESPVEQASAVNDLRRETKVREALLAGVRRPDLHLDAAGAVFLAGFPLA